MFWKLTLAYDGTGFHGWQIQPGLSTVQGTLAATLRQTFGETVLPQGSGRTDTGVHALAQVCSFALAADVPPANLLRALNRVLPASIRVLSAETVPESFHARHSVRAKTYEYRLWERRSLSRAGELPCSPFLAPYIWDCRWPLSCDAMRAATQHLIGTHDFTSFTATDLDGTARASPDSIWRDEWDPQQPGPATRRGNIRTIHDALWQRTSANELAFRITGNGFLHHMVRNIVGTLVDVGRGALAPADIPRILAAHHRSAAGPTAPAQGLFLAAVDYGPIPEGASH